jgi:hypothetical protein
MASTEISHACRPGRCRKMTGSAARRSLVGGTARARRLGTWIPATRAHRPVGRLQPQPYPHCDRGGVDDEPAAGGCPGNVPVSKEDAALSRDSVANVSQIITLDKTFLTERVTRISDRIMMSVEEGLRTVLAL